jgi:hypothetical protein
MKRESEAEAMLAPKVAREKSIALAVILNLLPGVGYLYLGRWVLAIVSFAIAILLFLFTFGLALPIYLPLVLIHTAFSVRSHNRKLGS